MKYLITLLLPLILVSCSNRDTDLQVGDVVTNGVCTGSIGAYQNRGSSRDVVILVALKCPKFTVQQLTDDAQNWKRVK